MPFIKYVVVLLVLKFAIVLFGQDEANFHLGNLKSDSFFNSDFNLDKNYDFYDRKVHKLNSETDFHRKEKLYKPDKFWLEITLKPKSTKKEDLLTSDYGEFSQTENNPKDTILMQDFYEKRPTFKTTFKRKKFDINPEHENNQNKLENATYLSSKQKISSLFKKYIGQLYQEKFNNTKNDFFSPTTENITKFDVVPKIDINSTKIGDEPPKSKFIDTSILTDLKNKALAKKMKLKNLLSIFQVVQFNNTECTGNMGSVTYLGTCFTSSECDQMGGTAVGPCAENYGVCCVFGGTCGGTSSQNCTYFTSPNYPDYYPSDGSNGGTISPTLPPMPPIIPPIPTPGVPDPRLPPNYLKWYNNNNHKVTNKMLNYHEYPEIRAGGSYDNNYPSYDFEDLGIEKKGFKMENVTFYDDIGDDLPLEGRQQTSDAFACGFQVSKISDDIQQFRIDFEDLELKGPTNGNCMDERLVISGQNLNTQVPVICGYNSGMHIYVDVSSLQGPLQLSVLASTAERKRFKIRICQIPNNQACNAPSGNCLQYYTTPSGFISSFNYDQSAVFNRSSPGYFNNLNYAICIRREAGYCSITYTNVVNNLEYPFQLVNFDPGTRLPTVPEGQAGIDIFNCPDDYIVINGVRLCGYKLNDGSMQNDLTQNFPVTDNSAGPIVIQVRTNSQNTGRGFKIFYMQNRCTN